MQDAVELMEGTMCDTVLADMGGRHDPRSRSRGGLQVRENFPRSTTQTQNINENKVAVGIKSVGGCRCPRGRFMKCSGAFECLNVIRSKLDPISIDHNTAE